MHPFRKEQHLEFPTGPRTFKEIKVSLPGGNTRALARYPSEPNSTRAQNKAETVASLGHEGETRLCAKRGILRRETQPFPLLVTRPGAFGLWAGWVDVCPARWKLLSS